MTASKARVNYIENFFNDLGYNRAGRNVMLSEVAGHEIKFIDDLNTSEASAVINILKEQAE
jgi:hypothetical protein